MECRWVQKNAKRFIIAWETSETVEGAAAKLGLEPGRALKVAWHLRWMEFNLKQMRVEVPLEHLLPCGTWEPRFVKAWNLAETVEEAAREFGVSPRRMRRLAFLLWRRGFILKAIPRPVLPLDRRRPSVN
jgi:hypothetical protein